MPEINSIYFVGGFDGLGSQMSNNTSKGRIRAGGLRATWNNWMTMMMMISEPEPNSLKAEATRFSVEKSRDKVDQKDRTAPKKTSLPKSFCG